MVHKIAIITTGFRDYDQCSDSYERVVDSITDWDEVSDDDFKVLVAMQDKLEYRVIERPRFTDAFVRKTVASYKEYVLAEERRLTEEKEQRAKAAADRKLKKELKDKKSKTDLLAKLVAELGPDEVKSVLSK